MNSQTYVSDPKLWEVFYENMAEKKFNPYKYRPKQKGRGWSYKKSYRIPVRPHAKLEDPKSVPLVTPVAAVEDRMKEEYKKDVEEGNPHVRLGKSIKRKSTSRVASSSKRSRRSTPSSQTKKKYLAKPPKQKAKPSKRTKRTLKIDKHRNNVFA